MARPEKTHPLYQWRMANGKMPMQALADKIECTQSFLSQIENGKRQPSLDTAARLSRETGIPIAAFAREAEVVQ
jgi:transcriptional regulator with XRE-family HTH domain